jgi:hypothetical protein
VDGPAKRATEAKLVLAVNGTNCFAELTIPSDPIA